MSTTSKFFAGFLIGGAVGAIAGILLAPKSGAETREMLKNSTVDALKKADETVKEIQAKADDVVNDLQKKGEEIKEKLQNLLAQKDDEE